MEYTIEQLLTLPKEKQFEAMSLLWESMLSSGAIDQLPLPQEERELMDARMAAYKADPSRASSWPEARQCIEASLVASRK